MRSAARPAAIVVALSMLVLGGPGAWAVDDEPLTVENLPPVTGSEVAGHVESIAVPDVEAIDIPDIETFEPEVEESGDETVVSLDTDVLFRFGESRLTGSAEDAVAEAVADLPDGAEVAVVGHTDSIGSEADNRVLSRKRAQAVADVIAAERGDLTLEVSGKGESDPVAPNERGGEDNPQGRERNRRVELRYAS